MRAAGKLLLPLLIGITLVRAALVWLAQPSPEEAYFEMCAAHPAPAYFDGPAGTALLAAGLQAVDPEGWMWRLSAPVWALLASLACFALLRRVMGEADAALGVLLLNLIPAFNAAAIRVGPLMPALCFVFAALLCSWLAFEAEKKAIWWWLAAGFCVGAATAFLYAAALLLPAVSIFVLCSPKHRRAIDVGGLFLFWVIPGALAIPALRWNAAQDWIPLAGGTFETLWLFNWHTAGESALQMAAALSPALAVALLVGWISALADAPVRLRPRFVFLVGFPSIVVGIYWLLRGGDATFLLLMAAPLLLVKAWQVARTWRSARILAGLAVVLALVFSVQAVLMTQEEGDSWAEVATAVRDTFLGEVAGGRESLFLIAQDPAAASALGHYLKRDLIPPPGHPTVYVRESQDVSSEFSLWPSYDDFVETKHVSDEYFTEQKGENPFVGRDALYITTEPPGDLPQSIKGAFGSVSLRRISLLERFTLGESSTQPLYIYLCQNYQTLPL